MAPSGCWPTLPALRVGENEFGLYAALYHDKTHSGPVFDFVNGDVHVASAENIRTVGASVTSSLGQLNWALEASVRQHTPLNSDPAELGFAQTLRDRANVAFSASRTF